jgi:chromosome partitioning protein
MATVTALASQKGGTGKTALAGALGVLLAVSGSRVLLVDLDQQADLTTACGHNSQTLDYSVVDVLAVANAVSIEEAIVPCVHGVPTLHLLAGDLRLAALERQIVGEMGRERLLRRALSAVTDAYDVILIDCPPSLGDLTINGLCASHDVVAPVSMEDRNAVQGAANLLDTLAKLRSQDQVIGVRALVRVKADERRSAHRALVEDLQALGAPVARTEVRSRAAWNNAAVQGRPVPLGDPASDATADARALAAELWGDRHIIYPSEIVAALRQTASGNGSDNG